MSGDGGSTYFLRVNMNIGIFLNSVTTAMYIFLQLLAS